MKKIIHYCWFGGKPLPKLAKKCIKSWKKYLPDYEIMKWDETNFDVNITDFSKEAYKQKKWAFVSDVARAYALKKYGGIYFDTDMLITKNIDFLLDDDFFVGWESSDYIAVGVLGAKEPNNEIINSVFQKYKELSFDENNLYSFSIPKILTKLLKEEYGLKSGHLENQVLKNNVHIYARDYFYPLSYNYKNNMFTKNTCMIHYYDASWISKGERAGIKLYRTFGEKNGERIIKTVRFGKSVIRTTAKICLFPFLYIKRKLKEKKNIIRFFNDANNNLDKIKDSNHVVIYNPKWLGTTYATKELFDNTMPIEEIHSLKIAEIIGKNICERKFDTVVFSAFAIGWEKIIRYIKKNNPNITIKIIWHGSNSLNIEDYDWLRFSEIFKLYREKMIDSIGFVKKSMAEFYKLRGYNTEFVMNTVHIDDKMKSNKYTKSDQIKIGIYASGDRWVKNFYNQLSAASLVQDSIVDCIPINNKVYEFAEIIHLKVTGSSKPIPRDELLNRMKNNDINVYATFTECAPMLPLESFELGVPCITSNNHHYWENHELRKYIVVEENDNVIAIYEKIKYCLENKEKVLKLYKEWKKEYDKEVEKNIKEFISKKE